MFLSVQDFDYKATHTKKVAISIHRISDLQYLLSNATFVHKLFAQLPSAEINLKTFLQKFQFGNV